MKEKAKSETRIMRTSEVRGMIGLSRITLWRKVADGDFPAPIQLGGNSIGWLSHEIEAWLASRPRVNWKVGAQSK